MNGRRRSRYENPLAARAAEVMSKIVQHLWRIMLRINRNGEQPHIGLAPHPLLQSVHLRRHAGAWPRAIGVNKIGYPNLAGERVAFEHMPLRVRHFKFGNMAVIREVARAMAASPKTDIRRRQGHNECSGPP